LVNFITDLLERLEALEKKFNTTNQAVVFKKAIELVSISSTLNARVFYTKICFSSFFNIHVARKSCQNVTFIQKMRAKNVDEIDTWNIRLKMKEKKDYQSLPTTTKI
jgi:hypothetical protein